MGFLDSYFRLTSMTDEMSGKTDVAASLASMQSKLDALNASMQAPVQSSGQRVDATATVTSARPTGTQVNGASVVELDLLVMLPAGIPMPVTQTSLVPPLALARTQAGSRLAVTLDPAQPATLVVDWSRAA